MYVVQRTCRARMVGDIAPWFVVLGYNFFIVIAGTGYLLGITQARNTPNPNGISDIFLAAVWVAYFAGLPRHHQAAHRPHIYVANWFYGAFIVDGALLHIVNSAAMPVSLSPSPNRLVGRAGCDGAVVVRPQRGRLLPDRRLPRHDVLLRAQAGRPAGLLATACRSSTSGR